ncbi:MAG: prolyl oligopeptidase family serine peptidase [Actinomycetota bacterium]|nr:prolyl oligopeptidase family serine peptidase [Actinomycetota bacterium]
MAEPSRTNVSASEQSEPADQHPAASIHDPLLPDPAAEQRWKARFSAVRISLPDPARDFQDRTVFVSNSSGRHELYCWDVASGRQLQCTDRPDGTTLGTLSANGQGMWWFGDTAGDEFGRWMAQPFGAAPGSAGEALQGVPPGYPAGLEVGQGLVLAGFTDDDGTRIHLARSGKDVEVVYRHENDGSVGALSCDERIWVLSHSEHGDSRYPSLRAISVDDGRVTAELDDAPGKGLAPLEFAPLPGDQRLLVCHERRGRDELLIWDTSSGDEQELDIDLPGELSGSFYRDGRSILVTHTYAGRVTLHRYHLGSKALTTLRSDQGMIDAALTRDDDSVWYRVSSAVHPAKLRRLGPVDGDPPSATTDLLTPTGGVAPDSAALTDLWVDGPGGKIHVFLSVPQAAPAPNIEGGTNTALPTVFLVHGGPAAADEDRYDEVRALWLDAGFAVAQVNYRGSTGYGSHWRDALTARVGHTELADIAAVQDRLTQLGIADCDACIVAGGSWGGFLTLLALGSQPSRWLAGVAAVPLADYPAAYRDEMEPLRAYDRALFGGSPQELPGKYADSSPLSWIDQVKAPVLILAGANDPRCPIEQINNYLDALGRRGADYAVYRFDAGHGSKVVDERIRQAAVMVGFALDVLGRHHNG